MLKIKHTLIMLFLLLLYSGCASNQDIKASKNYIKLENPNQPLKTLAILPFENNSITDPSRFDPLSKGLSAMLISDLNKNGTGIKLIERAKIESILKEISLTLSGNIDETTAVKTGKLLGAHYIAFGSFVVLDSNVRIDTRIIRIETSEIIMAENIEGNSNKFLKLESDLAKRIAESLKIVFMPKSSKQGDIAAALYFSKGLQLSDKGDKILALEMFKKCVEMDSSFKPQVDEVINK